MTSTIRQGFYGNERETFYVTARGACWLVQSPDLGSGVLAVGADAPEGDEIAPSLADDLQDLAARLERLPRDAGGPISERDFARVEIDDIDDAQIEALRDEAARAGDLAMVDVARVALRGGVAARARCAEAIRDAAAQGGAL